MARGDSAPVDPPRLVVRGRPVDLGEPAVMGIVNATPDSFSDGGRHPTARARIDLAVEQVEAGATIVDVGGQSGITGVPEVPVAEEVARVVPVIEGIRDTVPQALISVDAYRPPVVAAALDAGASIVNDISGLAHPEVADLCAGVGAGLVVMHTRVQPKVKMLDPTLYGDGEVTADVVDFLAERLAAATARGVAPEATIVDPGPDFAKTPHQTVQLLRDIDRLPPLGRPVLLALSRKDFVGTITGRRPRQRLGGTLAAIGHVLDVPGIILRVHDVGAVVDYLRVAGVLAGRAELRPDALLAEHLRRECE